MLEKLTTIPARFFNADGTRLSFLGYAFLAMLCLAFFTPGIATMPPTDRDESSFAQASKQMVETSNYIDIRLQDQPRYKKPIGIYWLQSAAVRVLNPRHLDEIWAYRIPSLIGATIAVLMTAALGALLFTPATGLVAGMMMAGCVLLNVEARLAKTDAMLLACIMVAQYGLAWGYKRGLGAGEQRLASGTSLVPFFFWTAVAAGVLIKGPIIFLPIVGTLLWLRVSDKNIGWFKNLRPLIGFPYALALIAPWFLAIIAQSHGAFIEQSAGHDMLAKLWQGQNRGMMPPGMHVMALPLTFFPFALFVFFAAPDVWKNRRDPMVKFCLGWIVVTWLVFELSLTKLLHYVLPAYPALALLTARYLLEGFPSLTATTRRLPTALIVGLWLMVGMGLALFAATLPDFIDHHWSWTQIAASGALLVALCAALLLLPTNKIASLSMLTIGSLIFLTTLFGQTIPGLGHIWLSREIIEAARDIAPCPTGTLIATGYHEPSLVFMAGTDTILASDGAAAARALKQDACRIAVIDPKNKADFLNAFAGSTQQPQESATVEGLNSGHGAAAVLTLYRMGKP